MIYGSIQYQRGINPGWCIEVYPLGWVKYIGWSRKAAIAEYRRTHNLQRRHIEWCDYDAPIWGIR